MIKKTIYLSLLLDIIKVSNDLDIREKKEYNYKLEIDYIKEKNIKEDDYIIEIDLINNVEDKIFKEVKRLEEEKDIDIDIIDWEFQMDIDDIDDLENMSMEERETLLKEEDIILNINKKDERMIYLNNPIKNILEERRSFLI